jgi:arabinan endo-1,5-alpha-L-arabinosidase
MLAFGCSGAARDASVDSMTGPTPRDPSVSAMASGTGGAPAAASGGSKGTDRERGATTAGAGPAADPPAAGRGGSNTTGGAAAEDPMRPPRVLELSGSLRVHDPAILQADETYFIFSTGTNIPVRRSADLVRWEDAGTAFSSEPSWMADAGIAFDPDNSMWAPDVSFFGATYHLYYSVSSFGMNDSCIGHAIRPRLDRGEWIDQGSVLCSRGQDYNAIDPGVALDDTGAPWLTFGSFWTGIKLVRLSADGARMDGEILSLAGGRERPNAIEAPTIVRRGSDYYLFVSLDTCCQGKSSTYKLAVGRASGIQGPYLDMSGRPLREGGGTILLRGSEGDLSDDIPYAALGHNSVLVTGDAAFNVYHAYRESDGVSVLRIAELVWDSEGWPVSGGP